jgi:penicillin-binding protein 2
LRAKFILFIFFAFWLSLIVRVYYISIQSNEHYDELANKNTIKTEAISPIRGDILDRKSRPIAINKIGFKISIKPHLSRKNRKKILREEIKTIVELLPHLDADKLYKDYHKKDSYYNHNYIDLVGFIDYNTILPVYSILNLRPNLKLASAQKRFYPNKNMAAHMIGYISKANRKEIKQNEISKLTKIIGKSGLEKYYNDYLQGIPGERVIQVSAYNEEITQIAYTKPKDKNSLVLALDIELQRYIQGLFKEKGQNGAVVVMDTNGFIYAAGSYPEYDLNSFVGGISTKEWKELINNEYAPFTNKLTSGLYPPGSVVKPGMGLIFLNSGLVNKNTQTYCTSNFEFGGRVFRCWNDKGHKHTNVTKAIRESCDDYFYKNSLKVGISKMAEGLKRMGLGTRTGIDTPNEFIGTVPSKAWKMKRFNKPWYQGETLNTSIGQGDFLVTPMQIARHTALMATGKMPTPRLVLKKGKEHIQPEFSDPLSEDEKSYLPTVQYAMMQVANSAGGTARWALREAKVTIAGKTGTAQVVGIAQKIKERMKEEDMAYFTRSHAWLTTYAPYENPQFIVTVMVEHGGHGGSAAGGTVAKIYNKLLELGHLKK